MKAIHYLKENYMKIISLIILAVISSALTCLLLWPSATPVMASTTDSQSVVEQIVKNEVERYIEEKGDVITRDDLRSMSERINTALNDSGLGMRTEYQSMELDKIVQSCIDRVLAGDRDAADSAAKDIAMLIKRISDNDKAYADLVTSYNSYQAEMSTKIKNLSDEAARLSSAKADKGTTEKDSRQTTDQINTVEKLVENVSDYTKEFEKETQERLSGIDGNILSNREKFSEFLNTYNEYRSDLNDILDSKAGKNDLESLRSKAGALEERLSNVTSSLADSLGGKKLWVGSREDYDAIASKDPDTLYFIK